MISFLINKVYAETYTLLEPLSGGAATSNIGSTSYYTLVYRNALVLTVALAVLMIVIGGIQYSASSINPAMKSEAKTRIFSALGGLLLALFSWLILQTINPNLLGTPNFL